MFICCGWFIGDGVRAPMDACDICAFCIAIVLNWLIPVGKADLHNDFIRNRICDLIFAVLKDTEQALLNPALEMTLTGTTEESIDKINIK